VHHGELEMGSRVVDRHAPGLGHRTSIRPSMANTNDGRSTDRCQGEAMASDRLVVDADIDTVNTVMSSAGSASAPIIISRDEPMPPKVGTDVEAGKRDKEPRQGQEPGQHDRGIGDAAWRARPAAPLPPPAGGAENDVRAVRNSHERFRPAPCACAAVWRYRGTLEQRRRGDSACGTSAVSPAGEQRRAPRTERLGDATSQASIMSPPTAGTAA